MTDLPFGIYGATRQTQMRANPREVIRRLMVENPDATELDIYRLAKEIILNDPEMVDAVWADYFANEYRNLKRLQSGPRQPREQASRQSREQAKAEEHREVERLTEVARVRILMGRLIMPNGKEFRDCTFGYVLGLSDKYRAIGLAGNPDEVIGDKLTEDEIKGYLLEA